MQIYANDVRQFFIWVENIEFRCFKYITDNADKNSNIDWNENLALGINAFSKFINDEAL